MSALREYAASMADARERIGHPSPFHAALVERGTEAEYALLPEGETCGQAKNCYGNSALRALDVWGAQSTKLTYYEGVALVPGIGTIEHAWCQDADGRVYDLTLRHQDPRCPYCEGEGELHPSDHWAADPADWEEIEDESETVPCEMCDGTGDWEPVDRTGVRYLGVPFDDQTLRRFVVELGRFGPFLGLELSEEEAA